MRVIGETARLLALGLVALSSVSCDEGPRPPAGQWSPLLDQMAWQAAWQKVAAADDPLAAHRPPQVVCSYERGYSVEDLDLELDTGACNYVALEQPVAYRLLAGDALRLVLWHYPLTSTLPATAHAALLLDGEVLWQRDVPIPKAADLYDVTVALPRDLPPGAAVGLHLHNHGANQWRVQPLLIRPR